MPAIHPSIAFAALAAGLLFVTVGQAQDGRIQTIEAYDVRNADLERGRAVVVGAYAVPPGLDAGEGRPPIRPAEGACFRCHGIDGRGDRAAIFPRLTDQTFKYLYDSLKDYASGVRQNEIMGPIARALTDRQMRDVSAYYAAQKEADYPPPERVDPEVLQLGAALAAIGNAQRGVQGCINCHGPDGIGLPPTYPYLAGQYAAYLEAQMLAWKTGRRKGDGFGIMENISKRLTDEEIHAVSQYYASIRPPVVTPEIAETGAPMTPLPIVPVQPVRR
ncbi:c-type cytochrome [Microvirga roseola]|uniref:c-type cytochrome n=1 Tax=Microvirga roseola TaxID=2883126 RepID=UPI001E34BF80|nr:c-type cytochrome [Microvirga roseola]